MSDPSDDRPEPVVAVCRRRDRVLAAVESVLPGAGEVTADDAARAAEAALAVLPDGCRYDALFRTLLPLVGTTPARPGLRDLAWAVAARPADLRRGDPVVPGRIGSIPGAAAVQVTAATRAPGRRGKPSGKSTGRPAGESGARYRGRAVSGHGCPATVEWTWSLKFVAYLAARTDGLGFVRPRPGVAGRRYRNYHELVGMRFVADLSIAEGKLKLDAVRCPGSVRVYNQTLTEMRWRGNFECPFAFTHPCHVCPKGQASCPAACRADDLVPAECPRCRGTFDADPAWEAQLCPSCR